MTLRTKHMNQSENENPFPEISFQNLELPEGGTSNMAFWILGDGQVVGHVNNEYTMQGGWMAYGPYGSSKNFGKQELDTLLIEIIEWLNPYQVIVPDSVSLD